MNMDTLREKIAAQDALNDRFAKKSLSFFLDALVINSSPEPRRFGDIAEPWQREMVAPMVPAIDRLAGLRDDFSGPDTSRFMQILARGHNKSSLEAWIGAFLLLAARRVIHGYILAADSDQGRLVLEATEDMARYNPWIARQLRVTKNKITGPAGSIEVLPCDAASSMGLRGNFFIADEFVHWKRQKEWTALVSGLGKMRPDVFVAISNAGLLHTWQHDAFLDAERHPESWSLFHRPGTLASWMSPETIAANRRMLPPSEARRLIDNEWIDPAAECDYLLRPEVDACADLGERLGLQYRPRRQYGVSNYVAAIDYGPRRDRTALVVLHQSLDRVTVVDRLDVWQGSPESPVQIDRVEDWIKSVRSAFEPRVFVVDPYQMEGSIQWMKKQNIPVEAFASRGGAGNYEMAQHLRALIVEQRLAWYVGAGDLTVNGRRETLADELSALRVKRMPYGYRFDHENQRHDDRAVAITMAALRAVDHPFPQACIPPPSTQPNPPSV
jgi:hypothetical protein